MSKMGLVNYSDSETSDIEDAPTPQNQQPARSAFHKVTNPSEPRKIKVDLPTLQPEEASAQDDGPPTKKARTAGTFSGFNSMLPAPKRAAAQNAPKAGVSLKTSSEAAFSRAPPPVAEDARDDESWSGERNSLVDEKAEEPKIVGKTTRFKPLSVANNKKKKPVVPKVIPGVKDTIGLDTKHALVQPSEQVIKAAEPPPPKPKRSLFSVPQEDDTTEPLSNGAYEPLITEQSQAPFDAADSTSSQIPPAAAAANPTSLQSLTADMNLTSAQKRQLFGRHTKSGDVNIAHLNMENEYAANEQLRQAGEVVEHRAVKAIAPGKHSLQQLVNNARSQHEGLEDKWAEGRRERGEGGAKYGW